MSKAVFYRIALKPAKKYPPQRRSGPQGVSSPQRKPAATHGRRPLALRRLVRALIPELK
jgi:hypothetical protein